MQSTNTGYTPGWTARSTGHVAQSPWGYNLLTKGRALAGAFVGGITADASAIGTTEIAAGAVTQAKIASLAVGTTSIAGTAVTAAKIAGAAVTDAKRSMGWSTLTNGAAATATATLSGTLGGYLLTNVGSSLGVVITSSGTSFSVPTAGDHYRFNVDVTPGATVGIYIESTAATFDGTNKFLQFGENDQFATIEAASTVRWVVTSWSTGVSIAATT